MDSSFRAVPPFHMFDGSSWTDGTKSTYPQDAQDTVTEEETIDSTMSAESASTPLTLKGEDEYVNPRHMWQDQANDLPTQMRQFSRPQVPMGPPQSHSYVRVDPNFAASYAQSQSWNAPQSASATPTPVYVPLDAFGRPVPYTPSNNYTAFSQDPNSAISMSPQSSQGGWASGSSGDLDQRGTLQSPIYCPPSPQLVLRPDGIRKKNARFEIPKERNLQTIDALILASTDENEKKELKQQKRLLRNRQAALDSRQRKKSHTEKLEQEKKHSEKKMYDLEEAVNGFESSLNYEREQWMQQRHAYETALQQMRLERDEAIRTKTLETAELRKMNNLLKDVVRDLERSHLRHPSLGMVSDFHPVATDLNEFDFDDDWEHELRMIDGEDLRVDDEEDQPYHRQVTPKPPVHTLAVTETKPDSGFSWNTFYMCLLFGAFIASSGDKTGDLSSAHNSLVPSVPQLSEDYRAEAGNVLKAVLASGPDSTPNLVPTRSHDGVDSTGAPVAGAAPRSLVRATEDTSSTLDKLHLSLTTPTRRQELEAACSLSADSYNHIVHPLGSVKEIGHDGHDDSKPSALEEAWRDHQVEQQNREKAAGLPNRANEQSVLWEKVPEKVLRDFHELIQKTNAQNGLIEMEH